MKPRYLFFCLVFFVLLSQIALAASDYSYSDPAGATPAPVGNISETRAINPMDTVYWGETINTELAMGWTEKLVSADTGKIVDVSEYPRQVLIDPSVFTEGEWDQWYPTREPNGNIVAFYVKETRPTITPAVWNGDTQQVQEASNLTETVITAENYIMEKKHISDIVLAQGDKFEYNVSSTGYFDPSMEVKAWIFGERDMLLDVPVVNRTLTLTPEQTTSLGEGKYHLVVEQAGPNTILEAKLIQFSNANPSTTYHIESPFKSVPNIEIGGTSKNPGMISPQLYTAFMEWIVKYTDDDTVIVNVAVQPPSIDVTMIDDIDKETGHIWLIRGYTNLENGTPLFAILDEGKQTEKTIRANTVQTVATGEDPGDLREFSAALPIDYNNTPTGQHFVTVRASEDVYMIVPRWVYNIPEGQQKPILQTKYSGGNLFVPTPTPEIIKVPEPYEVVRTVIVTITPEPTPTPVPTPWFFESPWFYIEILIAVACTVAFVLWLMWKIGMI